MNYNKLWKLLIDKKLRKKDLREMAGLSTNVIAKMGKGGDVSTQVLRKICEALDCEPNEILVRVPNPEPRVRNRTGFEKPAMESKVGT